MNDFDYFAKKKTKDMPKGNDKNKLKCWVLLV